MKRLLAVFVVLAVIAVVVAERSSGVAGARRSRPHVSAVTVTPRLRRVLQGEIRSLRLGQPSSPRVAPARRRVRPPVVAEGVPCFTAGLGRCSEIPCREFAHGPPVIQTSSSPATSGIMPRKSLGRTCPRVPQEVLPVPSAP